MKRRKRKFFFLHVKYTDDVFTYIHIWLTDDRGTRPATLAGKSVLFSRYYKPRGVRTGVKYFTRIREALEQRGE